MTHPIDTTARAAVEGSHIDVTGLVGTGHARDLLGNLLCDGVVTEVSIQGDGPIIARIDRSPERASGLAALIATVEGAPERVYSSPANDNAPVRGTFMQTFSGRAVFPLDLRPDDIDIQDIAHALSMQCRYAGHTRTFYSVAEHSVHVAHWCRQYGPAAALEGLLHDATEAYLVDVPRPVKPFLVGYREAEQRAAAVIAERFGLDARGFPECVHEADNRILNDERAALMAPCEREWDLPYDQPLGVRIECWSPDRAKREFLALFDELYGED